jgi:hypothetical protein
LCSFLYITYVSGSGNLCEWKLWTEIDQRVVQLIIYKSRLPLCMYLSFLRKYVS